MYPALKFDLLEKKLIYRVLLHYSTLRFLTLKTFFKLSKFKRLISRSNFSLRNHEVSSKPAKQKLLKFINTFFLNWVSSGKSEEKRFCENLTRFINMQLEHCGDV